MSRRFGRNQKRRMRAELAEQAERVAGLEQAHAMDQGLLAHSRKMIEQATEFAEVVARALGRNAIAAGVPQELVASGATRHDQLRVAVYDELQPVRSYRDITPDRLLRVQHECLHLLTFDTVRNAMRQEVHVIATLAGKEQAYGIGNHALYSMSHQELMYQLVPHVAHGLTRKLLLAIRGER